MRILLLILFFTNIISFSQNGLDKELKTIEKSIKSNGINNFEKVEIDLDNDNDLDYIYLYQCAEPKCIDVYLNVNRKLEKVISEFCNDYFLYENNSKEDLKIKLNHCCGESPFTSIRNFNFKNNKVYLMDNYVIYNESYELLSPKLINSKPYQIKIINDNYNIRFSPNIKEYDEDNSMFSCEPKTNIIGKLKKSSKLFVLSELIKENRTWLFVEISSDQLNNMLCNNPIDYEFKSQKLRAWISGKFVEKL